MNWRNDPRWAYVFVNLSTLLWAGNITLGRALRGQVGPVTLTAVRVTIAGLLFLLLFRRLPPDQRRPGRAWPWLLGMALTGVMGFPVLLYLALRYTTASNGALINGSAPLVTAMLAAWLLREKLAPAQLAGAFLSLAGVTLIISGGRLDALAGFRFNQGDLLVLLAVGLWGLYSIMARIVMHTRTTVAVTALSTWFALPLLYPAAAVESLQSPPALSWTLILGMLYIGTFASFVAFLAWNEGVRRVGPARAMAFYNMLPVFGAVMGAAFLGEALGWGQALGGAMVIGGGLLSALGSLMRRKAR